MIPCQECPLRCHPLFQSMTDAEIAFMQQIKAAEVRIDPGTTFLLEGAASAQLYTVLSGMGLRHKLLEDGRRQVLNFLFPGDLAGLQAAVMGEMQHSCEAVTPMVLCMFHRADLWRVLREQPERAFTLIWLGAIEEHFLGETVTTLGQRDATERMAWAMLKLHGRLVTLGLADNQGWVPLPFRQQDLADALGLSLVHTNKTLARLRALGLVVWAGGRLRLDDREALARLAHADAALPQGQRPLF